MNKFHTAQEVADWFIAYGVQEGRRMSPLRIQMLLYYTQQHCQASKLGPIFLEPFKYGHGLPYLPSVLKKYQDAGLEDEDEITEYNEELDWEYYEDFQEILLVMFSVYCL